MKDFLISYNKADVSWAKWIAWQLEDQGYTTILQAWDFRPGSNFVLEMQKAMEHSSRTIAVLSPDYLTSRFTQPEWAAAFAEDPTGEKGLLVPIRVRDCEPKGLIPQIIYVDLVGIMESAARLELIEGVDKHRAKPVVAPSFPGTLHDAATKPRYPGALPRIWNVPHNRNPNFTGRDEVLTDLHANLVNAQSASPVQVIHGLGGVGKTQIAVEYAYLNVADYDVVWWMRAEESSTLASDFANLATELSLPQQDAQDQRVIVDAVRKWLGHNGDWLIVFDNARSAEDLGNFIPQGSTGHMVVTSRNPNWKGVARSIPLDVLTSEEAASFILKRTGQDKDASGLAEALGFLPLALEQAGAYIEETGRSIAEYLELFGHYQIELLGRGNIPTLYPATVRTTWQISFQAAMEDCPIVTGVLGLIGFLAPDKIPRSLLTSIVKISTPPEDRELIQLHVDTAVASLRRYSLVDIVNNELSVHRLVLAICRDTFKSLAENLAAGVVGIINSVFPLESDDPRNWNECSSLLPHAFAAITYAEQLDQVFYPLSELLNKIATYFIGRGEYQDAKLQLEHALRIVVSIYGENAESVADIRSNLGVVCHYLGDDTAALEHTAKAIEINKRQRGQSDPSIGMLMNTLGLISSAAGRSEEALARYTEANEIAEANYGPDDLRVAITLDNIGCVLIDLRRIEEALQHFKRAQRIVENAHGNEHPQLVHHLGHIANVYAIKGRLSKALAKAGRALLLTQKFYGDRHSSVAVARLNLGIILRDLSDFGQARKEITQALEVLRESSGDNSPETLRAQRILAGLPEDNRA
jgi:tetratricopeptide (TPR) repeat protein